MADAAANPPSSSSSPVASAADAAAAAPPADAIVDAIVALGAEPLPTTQDDLSVFRVERDAWATVARALHDDPRLSFEMLVDVAGIDFPKRQPRFEVVYHLWSLTHNRLIRIKVGVPEEDPTCPSVVDLWSTADWHERECFDLVGVRFAGHPDLRRILMPDDYPWHPLRKDFPVEGIDNSISYVKAGGVLMTRELEVDRPAGQDRTPVDLSRGDPAGFSDGAAPVDEGGSSR